MTPMSAEQVFILTNGTDVYSVAVRSRYEAQGMADVLNKRDGYTLEWTVKEITVAP